ncbi:MAG: sensor histidine kinase [Pseudomonadota bacterium]
MSGALSLRARLTLIILFPLLVVSVAAGLWQLGNARETAADVFDRSLLTAALAVANDVAVSGGDALSPRTEQILADTSGARVYYHVYAPDGVIVAGYATPPVGIPRSDTVVSAPTYFEATYLGRAVSGVRLQARTQIDGFAGIFTTTVWQDSSVRSAFVRQLVLRSLLVIALLTTCVGLIVWFGVRLGLRPLLDLEEAIELRSSDDLSSIRRPVPEEVRGIVETLNRLFDQVSRSMTAQSEFISNAAHQLRNPIAGLLALADAVHRAPNVQEARARSEDMLKAARETADLTQKLLTIERAKALSPDSQRERIDLGASLRDWVPGWQAAVGDDVSVALRDGGQAGEIICDPTLLREAIANLVDNAKVHGGPSLSHISISVDRRGSEIALSVEDDGRGMEVRDIPKAVERFSQLSPTSGSGLGLPIAAAIAEGHGGSIGLRPRHPGLEVTLRLPTGCETDPTPTLRSAALAQAAP